MSKLHYSSFIMSHNQIFIYFKHYPCDTMLKNSGNHRKFNSFEQNLIKTWGFFIVLIKT